MEREDKNINLEYKVVPMNEEEAKDYYKYLNIIDLSDEFFAYKSVEDKESKKYKILCDEIMSRDLPDKLSGKSAKSIANKCSKEKAVKYVNFYNELSKEKRKLSCPNLLKFSKSKLMRIIKNSFGYNELTSNTERAVKGFSFDAYIKGKYFKKISSF